MSMKLTFEISDDDMVHFEALSKVSKKYDSVHEMLEYWIDTLSEGIRRSGSWERQILYSAFGNIDAIDDAFHE